MPLGTSLIRQSLWQDPCLNPFYVPCPSEWAEMIIDRCCNRCPMHTDTLSLERSMHSHTIVALFVLSEPEHLLRILAYQTEDLGKNFATAVRTDLSTPTLSDPSPVPDSGIYLIVFCNLDSKTRMRTGWTLWRDPVHVRVAKGVQKSGTDYDDYVRKAS